MKYLDTPTNGIRYNNNTIVNNGNNNATGISEDAVRVLCMLDECSGLRIKLCDFIEYCVEYHWNVQRIYTNDFSNIEIDESGPIFCSKTCKAGLPDITMYTTGKSDQMQRDENGS